ncbi:MAG: sulfotransferase, partial [Undibacterium sp.]|nr:sulfotransferase [Undibacterium sp.]
MMCHWNSTLPAGNILEVKYEDMVFDFENQARRLIEFIGLPWNKECLDFHTNSRAVLTASASQVRKPVYQSSIQRWRKYEGFLQPLYAELSPLIEAYEAELEQSRN